MEKVYVVTHLYSTDISDLSVLTDVFASRLSAEKHLAEQQEYTLNFYKDENAEVTREWKDGYTIAWDSGYYNVEIQERVIKP